ncbi:fumarylacetoacetate hydrolase family protein [Flavobacterium salilacus subsp. salilacus]|uniref:fumarylacetoacetate hydrolase family protein n=1 Tax=Flavobacterium TaxID=237 RepID=UPI0010757FC1|nr:MULTISPECIES: fumarylacetoacetate hydrolase family protein [Flavobacterium]KAF2518608.1 fumarylacetoacetate hydrolase family protein [Flavobacterium salilacus subsp. salilacus]MBE1613565.1 fumarylacetoacetate hydrolase family protein [Flavobacterium sp. SaA2.13]
MKLVTYKINDTTHQLGFIKDETIINAEQLGQLKNSALPNNMLDFIDMGKEGIEKATQLINEATKEELEKCSVLLANAKLMAPIPKPRKNIIGIGLNYTEHVAESARTLDTSKDLPQQPVIFSKPPTAVTGTNENIIHNQKITQQLDYEVELAVIIGKRGKNVPKEQAMEYVYGYTVINDISARDCRRSGQWIVSKGQDTFAPMGPVLVTADEIADPHNLNLSLKLNGEERQNSNTKFMLFNINDLINDISTVFTIESGDIIATGTPAGVGAGMTPQSFMWPGDVVEATVEGIGTITNTIVDSESL